MADLSGSERPVGTMEELSENGLDPRSFGSCSMRTNVSKGCAWFKQCRFRAWRDRVGGKAGPVNCAVRVILSSVDGGASDTKVLPCFDYYYSGLHDRQRQSADTGEVIKIVAIEGDGKKVRCRITKRAHPTPDPSCIACNERKCMQRVETIEGAPDGIEVPKFERPSVVYAIAAEAMRAREEIMLSEESEITAAAMAKQEEMRGPGQHRAAGNR